MGACQSVYGAATSGQGLTGRQVAEALKATAVHELRSHQSEQQGLSKGVGDNPPLRLEELDAKYTETRVLEIEVPNSQGEAEKVIIKEYAPEVFRFLRYLDGLDDEDFAEEWTLPKERLELELGDGRSMALFLKSKSMNMMCKTIADGEVQVLLGLLQQYTKYVSVNPNTLLMRFSTLLHIRAGTESGFVLCFDDVFAPCRTLNEKWDLKGRKPKPGKYVHFPKLLRQPHEPHPYTIDTPREVIELSNRASPLGAEEVLVEARDKFKLATGKDKDLTRLFWLEKEQRCKLVQTLMQDYQFLRTAGMMDYSLLIGVTYNEAKVSRSGKHIRSMRKAYPLGSKSEVSAAEIRPKLRLQNYRSQHEFAKGIASLYDQETYYIGIIDMLTQYTLKKKMANFLKSFLWKSETLSTVPPRTYHDRIARYTLIVFPDVDITERPRPPR
ncbi:putative phosphatidylinositol-4-phosphate 5-kinase-like protein [Trypanosoma vivax]|nr:putative phosphatidylinositol-4-phosphate 5-kinase-like protein [Trypanosoma vivax]